MADIREATALILLYRACADSTVRERARSLVPELAVLGDADDDSVRGYEMIAWRTDPPERSEVDRQTVVCRPSELGVHERTFARRIPFADVSVASEEVVR